MKLLKIRLQRLANSKPEVRKQSANSLQIVRKHVENEVYLLKKVLTRGVTLKNVDGGGESREVREGREGREG